MPGGNREEAYRYQVGGYKQGRQAASEDQIQIGRAGDQPIEDVLSMLDEHRRRLFSRGGLQKILVKELLRPEMQRISHQRFIRFDSTWIDIDNGLELFHGTRIERDCSFSTKLFQDDLRQRENKLQNKALNIFELSPTGTSKL